MRMLFNTLRDDRTRLAAGGRAVASALTRTASRGIAIAPTVLASAFAAISAPPASADLIETRTLEESVPIPRGAPLTVIVDNVNGPIRVTAHDRDSVDMAAVERVRGDLQADIERARREMQLVTESEPGRVAFRVRGNGDCGCGHRRRTGYSVEYDIDVRVPAGASIDLQTVNGGDIVVEGVHGEFEVENVNGAVVLQGLRAAGSAETVNGRVTAVFERTPEADLSLETVNGSIDVTFPAELAADLKFETMRGEIYTDFDAVPIAREATAASDRDGRARVFRLDRSPVLRIGGGGPEHELTTVNGNIYVRKADQ